MCAFQQFLFLLLIASCNGILKQKEDKIRLIVLYAGEALFCNLQGF